MHFMLPVIKGKNYSRSHEFLNMIFELQRTEHVRFSCINFVNDGLPVHNQVIFLKSHKSLNTKNNLEE